MDMSYSQMIICPPAIVRLAMLVAILWPFIALPLALMKRRLGFAFTFVPLLVSGGVAFLQLAHVVEFRAISNVRVWDYAVAEVKAPLIFAAIVSAFAALVEAWYARRHPSPARANLVLEAIAITAFIVVALEPLLASVLVQQMAWRVLHILAGASFLGALAALFATRGGAVRPLLIAAACEALVAGDAWLV